MKTKKYLKKIIFNISHHKCKIIFPIALIFLILKLMSFIFPDIIEPGFWEYQNIELSKEVKNCDFKIHFIDVGKADCSLVKCGDIEILIDAGDICPRNKVKSYLKRIGIKDIDLVIISHPDLDHIGQMRNIIDNFRINKVIVPDISENIEPHNSVYNKMCEAFEYKDLEINKVSSNQKMQLGEILIDIISPEKQYENLNNNSIVCKITYKNKSFLFMGDAEQAVEDDILVNNKDIKSDLLKVGHHGSKTSTSESFLTKVRPKYAVISVGKNNYGLPKLEILNRLQSLNIKTYRTDLNGTISVGSNGEEIYICTEKAA